MTCPLCHTSEDVDPLDDGRYHCGTCNVAWRPEPQPRLIDPEPRRRRDVDD